jgi:hypothetical protein
MFAVQHNGLQSPGLSPPLSTGDLRIPPVGPGPKARIPCRGPIASSRDIVGKDPEFTKQDHKYINCLSCCYIVFAMFYFKFIGFMPVVADTLLEWSRLV